MVRVNWRSGVADMTKAEIIAELRRSALAGRSFAMLTNPAYYAQANMRTVRDLRHERSDQSRMFLLFVACALEDEC